MDFVRFADYDDYNAALLALDNKQVVKVTVEKNIDMISEVNRKKYKQYCEILFYI